MPSAEPAATSAASEARYGPRKTVPACVLKAELAQSYMAHPRISRRSLMIGVELAVMRAPHSVMSARAIRTGSGPFAAVSHLGQQLALLALELVFGQGALLTKLIKPGDHRRNLVAARRSGAAQPELIVPHLLLGVPHGRLEADRGGG